MAVYLAMQIEKGKLTYEQIKKLKDYQKYKEDIDTILIADGYEYLIV